MYVCVISNTACCISGKIISFKPQFGHSDKSKCNSLFKGKMPVLWDIRT